jgi:hypothetical protein
MACEAGCGLSNEEESGINSMWAQEIFSSASRPLLGLTQPLSLSLHFPDVWGPPNLVSNGYRGLFLLVVERPEREPDR